MTQQEINDMISIAKFMGYKESGDPEYLIHPETNCDHSINNTEWFNYNSSWDWLMPVVNKIKTIVMEDNTDELYNSVQWDNIVHCLEQISINDLYVRVIEFIKWYNKQQQVQRLLDDPLCTD